MTSFLDKDRTGLFRGFLDFYQTDTFTDCEIRCKESAQVVKAHRFVLAAASSKLKNLLKDSDPSDEKCVIHLMNIRHTAAKAAIDLVYKVLTGHGPREFDPEVTEVLSVLGIQLENPRPKTHTLRKATPEEIAKIKASMMRLKKVRPSEVKVKAVVKRPATDFSGKQK